MRAKVVIGANFGDEGKGLVTDWLVSKDPTAAIVVRYNGGAQAGHTVVQGEDRHVFSHFGAGTFQGAPTFFTKDFILNPIKFFEEREILRNKFDLDPIAYVDPRCKITTPWDMIYNQTREEGRGEQAHGSCGLGIHATNVRHSAAPLTYEIAESMISKPKTLKSYLRNIMEWYAKVSKLDVEFIDDVLLNRFFDDLKRFLEDSKLICALPYGIPKSFTNYVFEGAQGLMLDRQYTRYFPHLTDSNTGLRNFEDYVHEFGIKHLDLFYVTRTYMTRHGNGPFETEDPKLTYEELTNVTNKYQGRFRFGHLDVDLLASNIESDRRHIAGKNYTTNVVMTHCDQSNPDQKFIIDGNEYLGQYSEHKDKIRIRLCEVDVENVVHSYGPTRYTILE